MRFKEKLDEELSQERIDEIFLKSASNQVFRKIKDEIDNYIGNISIDKKDIPNKKKFAYKIILKNLSKREKDIK